MTSLPKIAVCIPTYNQADYLSGAIDSALDQVGVDTRIWVSDDASTDNTGQILDRYSANPRVTIIRNPINLGLAGNTQKVMELPELDYIVRLDSDDLLYADYCRQLALLLDRNPSAAVAHCAVNQIDEHGCKTSTRRLARRSGCQPWRTALGESIYGYKVAANICMFRKRALESVPFLYDQALNFAEDWDLYVRLADANWGNAYSSKVLASYRVWNDASGVRSGRKAAEIIGITHVLTRSVQLAWSSRGWDVTEISAARKRFALGQLEGIEAGSSDPQERESLLQLINELAGGDVELFMDSSILGCLGPAANRKLAAIQRELKILLKQLLYR